jgi:hypothetical protein
MSFSRNRSGGGVEMEDRQAAARNQANNKQNQVECDNQDGNHGAVGNQDAGNEQNDNHGAGGNQDANNDAGGFGPLGGLFGGRGVPFNATLFSVMARKITLAADRSVLVLVENFSPEVQKQNLQATLRNLLVMTQDERSLMLVWQVVR